MKHLKIALLACLFSTQMLWAADKIKPYIQSTAIYESSSAAINAIKNSLQRAGFSLSGQYSPYPGATVMAVTHANLLEAAGLSENGGFGAVIRVSVTESSNGIQVAYQNPEYLMHMYQLKDISSLAGQLSAALGAGEQFGAEKGMSPKQLKKYHYMMGMPYFDDVDELAEYDSHESALDSIEQNLKAGVAGTSKVYRVDVPGKNVTLFGVAIESGEGADEKVMNTIDTGILKHTAHLPYEILVNNGEVIALRGRFRIAQSFPDLSMGSFMKIRSAPGSIKDTLEAVAVAN